MISSKDKLQLIARLLLDSAFTKDISRWSIYVLECEYMKYGLVILD